jgi:hypothetical protein
VEVPLPRPRDQVQTKELQEFAQLRAHVYRLIKGTQTDGSEDGSARVAQPGRDPVHR